MPKVAQMVDSWARIRPWPAGLHSSQLPKPGGQAWEPTIPRHTIRNNTNVPLKKLESGKIEWGFQFLNLQAHFYLSGKIRHHHQCLSHLHWTWESSPLSQGCRMARSLSGGSGGESPLGNGPKPPRFDSQDKEWGMASRYTHTHSQPPGSQSQHLTLRSRVDIGGPISQIALSSGTWKVYIGWSKQHVQSTGLGDWFRYKHGT